MGDTDHKQAPNPRPTHRVDVIMPAEGGNVQREVWPATEQARVDVTESGILLLNTGLSTHAYAPGRWTYVDISREV